MTADPREDARAAIVARYGSEAAALTPCSRERALSDATWKHVIPGDPETGPSLMGWRDGPASDLRADVRRDVVAAITLPADATAAAAEAAYWSERAEARGVLDGPPLPVWVRARLAIIEEILPPTRAPELPAPPPPPTPAEPSAEANAGQGQSASETAKGSQDPATEPAAVQSGQPKRTRREANEAVRALLGEDLTDREIARRVGVSPSTVAAVKAEIEKTGT